MLIGREVTASDVRNWTRQSRFVTLLGPDGVNKTTVAVTAGHDEDVKLIAALVQVLKSAALIE
jgi:predicted ATPase